VIGAKTLVTLTLFVAGVAAAISFGVLAPERLLSRGADTLFFVGCFAVVVGTLVFRFWRLGEPSLHYFRFASRRDHWTSEEAHFVGGQERRITLGDNRGEAFDLGPRLQGAVWVAIALLLALACIDARALGLLYGLGQRAGQYGASWCAGPEAQAPAADPNVPGCELMRRAYALGYVKSLGQCAPAERRAAAVAPCTRRQRDEPALHYAWRLLDGTWMKLLRPHAGPAEPAQRDLGARPRLDRAGERGRAELQMLATAPHASHQLWTNLPDPGHGAFRPESCTDRYRWMAHRPAPTSERRASQVLEHVLAQLLFESRYEPAAASCREVHVHWGAALDTCKRLAADPRVLLASTDVATVLERERFARQRPNVASVVAGASVATGAFVTFQCYFEGDAEAPTSTAFDFAGHHFTVEELHVPPSPAGATLYTDRYDAVARLFAPGFHYGALLSEAGVDARAAGGMQAAFAGHDYLLTRLYGLDAIDIYLDPGFLTTRPDLLEVYPYERHLRNYVELFRRQYARLRGRL
jgi:hypothetical protein